MIFLLILYYLFLHGNVLAGPLPASNPTAEIPPYSREIDPDKFFQRSEWSIVWSCFATIFSCAWVAIHPNIPAPSDSSTKIFFRRLMIMLYMLIVPEYVIIWAGRQWYAARDITIKHKDRGWDNRKHGFFASMGGFMLYENGVMTETLSIERLEELESRGMIHWPSISGKEIEDRSKGDVFSKAFAVLQTTWFITQCIARRIYGLAITELEVTTLAFAVLNGILYFLWWNKPLGVACPVPVYLIPSKREAGVQTTDSDYGETPDHPSPLPPILSDFSDTLNLSLLSNNEELSQPLLSVTKEVESTPFEQISFDSFQHLFKAFVRCCVKVFFIFYDCVNDMSSCTTIHGNIALSVPTFYAPSCGATSTTIQNRSRFLGSIIGTLFGGTHCIASVFPSVEEKYLWRASAATITGVPIITISIFFLQEIILEWVSRSGRRRVGSIVQLFESPVCFGCSVFKITVILMLTLCALAYFLARVALLTLPLIALRSLPPGSLVDIKWSSFIPHV